MSSRQKILTVSLLLIMALMMIVPIQAGDVILTNNNGNDRPVFFVEGETSLVMNGFDLTPLGVELPVLVDALTISVDTPVPGAVSEVVVYQDGNGGSPIDATLVARQQTTINTSGSVRIVLDSPAVITEPVIWVGFYLPVGFRFHGDQSGSSVLTYWAWSPGGGFDLNDLSTAAILGPSDGTEPVNINMDGVARISVELVTGAARTAEMENSTAIGVQISTNASADTSVLQNYPYCGPVYYDADDIVVSGRSKFSLHCTIAFDPLAPGEFANLDYNLPTRYQRKGLLYDIRGSGDYAYEGRRELEQLFVPVTHCIQPHDAADLESAVIALSYGLPRKWHFLPTVRYGDFLCAEVASQGTLSYFTIHTGETHENINLTFGMDPVVDPHPIHCGISPIFQVAINNSGQLPTLQQGKILIADYLIRTGRLLAVQEYHFPPIKAGEGWTFRTEDFTVVDHVGEGHRLEFTIDFDNEFPETDETDNFYSTNYVLQLATDYMIKIRGLELTIPPHCNG